MVHLNNSCKRRRKWTRWDFWNLNMITNKRVVLLRTRIQVSCWINMLSPHNLTVVNRQSKQFRKTKLPSTRCKQVLRVKQESTIGMNSNRIPISAWLYRTRTCSRDELWIVKKSKEWTKDSSWGQTIQKSLWKLSLWRERAQVTTNSPKRKRIPTQSDMTKVCIDASLLCQPYSRGVSTHQVWVKAHQCLKAVLKCWFRRLNKHRNSTVYKLQARQIIMKTIQKNTTFLTIIYTKTTTKMMTTTQTRRRASPTCCTCKANSSTLLKMFCHHRKGDRKTFKSGRDSMSSKRMLLKKARQLKLKRLKFNLKL